MGDQNIARCRQVINNDGHLLLEALKAAASLPPGKPYKVVSVLGAQGSGKSTLLNILFGTSFEVKSDWRGGKVTDGVWLECAEQASGLTLIFDIEGCDGFERMHNSEVERQFNLMALASADTLLLNIDYKDVERVQGGNLALLRTIIQEKLKLEADLPHGTKPHRTTLLTVMRDVPPPVENNSERSGKLYQHHLETIWQDMPQHGEGRRLSDYFNLRCFGLPNRVYVEEEFNSHCKGLQQMLSESGSGDLSLCQQVPAQQYVAFVERLWAQIRSAEGLKLLSVMAMLSQESCKSAMQHAAESFMGNSTWKEISNVCQEKLLPLQRLTVLVNGVVKSVMDDYSSKTQHYESIQAGKFRKKLQSKIAKGIAAMVIEPQASMMRAFRVRDFQDRVASESETSSDDEGVHPPASWSSSVDFGASSTLQAYSSVAAGFIDVLNMAETESAIKIICDKFATYLQQLNSLAVLETDQSNSVNITPTVVKLREDLRTMAMAACAQLKAEASRKALQEEREARQHESASSDHKTPSQEAQIDWSDMGQALCRLAAAGLEAYTASNNYEPQGSTSRAGKGSTQRQGVHGIPVGLDSKGRQVYEGPRGGQFTRNAAGGKVYGVH